jgi:Ca2+:H+ antiporter
MFTVYQMGSLTDQVVAEHRSTPDRGEGSEGMTTRKAGRARAANRNGVSSQPPARAVRPQGVTRSLGNGLRAEAPFVLAVVVIGLVKLIASSPEIGEVGHFGPLTLMLLVFIFGVVVYAAIGVVGHAELLAEKYGEPYGTLVLTLTAVAVEVVMLTTMMLHRDDDPTLARDTIFATVMILVNGLIGLSLLIGGLRYREQRYNVKSSKAFLTMLFALTGLALVLPDAVPPAQELRLEVFLVLASLVLYVFFLHVQTRTHAHFFVFESWPKAHTSQERGSGAGSRDEISGAYHATMLVVTIVAISLLVEYLSIALDDAVDVLHFPAQLPALVVAIIIISPESLAAIRAALHNDMQRTFNIALGSALSTVALTIPAVLLISFVTGHDIVLGLTPVQAALMIISLLVASIAEADGSTSALEGLVQLVLFGAFVIMLFA